MLVSCTFYMWRENTHSIPTGRALWGRLLLAPPIGEIGEIKERAEGELSLSYLFS